jgi:hypothetical protein
MLRTTDEALTSFDEPILDIYPPNDVYGLRIRSSGFDFSCLGEQMKSIAGSNMAGLIDLLRKRFASAIFNETYRSVSPLFLSVWPMDQIKRSSEFTRGPLGGIRKHSVTVLDNDRQFTKFSRLQRYFI